VRRLRTASETCQVWKKPDRFKKSHKHQVPEDILWRFEDQLRCFESQLHCFEDQLPRLNTQLPRLKRQAPRFNVLYSVSGRQPVKRKNKKTGNDLRRVLAGLFAQKSVFSPPEIQS
jgi:hypothetical protein